MRSWLHSGALRAIDTRLDLAKESLHLPSLLRFLAIVAALVALAYGAMVAIVSAVQPQPREMTYTIPAQRLNK